MILATYFGFVAAASALILLPGPNVALIVATSLADGRRRGLVVVAGTSSAMVLQLGAVAAGLTALMTKASHVFAVLRWVGVAYLLVLGVRALLAGADDPDAPRPPSSAFWRGFAVSLTNPKTLLFYGAFLPQFIDPKGDPGPQVALLAATFLGLAATLDSAWAVMADRARGVVSMRPRLRNRVTGTCLLGAAAGLALAHERT